MDSELCFGLDCRGLVATYRPLNPWCLLEPTGTEVCKAEGASGVYTQLMLSNKLLEPTGSEVCKAEGASGASDTGRRQFLVVGVGLLVAGLLAHCG